MKEELMTKIIRNMLPYLDNAQLEKLQEALQFCLYNVNITAKDYSQLEQEEQTNAQLLKLLVSAKRVEGCSEKTLRYYEITIKKLLHQNDKHITHMQTDDLRQYLSDYQKQQQCSKSNIDNIRRILSSFFA